MTLEQAEALVDALGDLSIEAELRAEYSGRGMDGKAVPAIVIYDESRGLVGLGYAAREAGVEFADLPRRRDSMGHDGIVIY